MFIRRSEVLAQRTLSIEKLARLLSEASTGGSSRTWSPEFHSALRTQGRLAAYVDSELGIVPMCLNTQKDLAIKILGSYKVLDDLRNKALDALERQSTLPASKSKHGSKEDLATKLRESEAREEALRCDLFVLQRAYDLRCSQARAYAESAGGAMVEKCKREQREVDASFSLLRIAEASNVASLESARNARTRG